MQQAAEADTVFVSTLPARPEDRRLALGVFFASVVVFLIAAPNAKVALAPVTAFLPVYQSALVVNDLITAVLLFGQFGILRSRALLVLASGYLFSACMAVMHLLSFPGLFAPTGLLGAGSQTTAWLYFLWHGVFPLFVIGYVLLRTEREADPAPDAPRGGAATPIVWAAAAVGLLAGILTWFTTAGHAALPVIMAGNADASAKVYVATATWMLSLAALVVLWRRQSKTVLDLWLMVVMVVWIFDIALASVLNHGRFDVGWYTGRIYGLAAATFVLVVLLLENGALYARLAAAHEAERRERRRAEQKTQELTAVNKGLEAFSYSASHDLRAPLRAVDGYARMLAEDYGERLEAEGRRLLGVVQSSVGQMSQLIDDLLAFSRLGRQPLQTATVPLDELVQDVLRGLQPALEGRRVEFDLQPLGTADADPALLKQVLVNLIGNAVKFTRDRDPAIVRIGRQPPVEPGGVPVYYVKDNGAGFEMKYYERLFAVFQRIHSHQEFEGTGVGLAIVAQIIERHGGRIWAESVVGEGASFYFTLGAAGREYRAKESPAG